MYFNDNIAKKYGFAEAILLQSIYNWCSYNKRNNKNNFDNKYWMFNTMNDFLSEFPYLKNKNTIRLALHHLKDLALIETGNYNNSCTRTTWYTVTDLALSELRVDSINDLDEDENLNKSENEDTKVPKETLISTDSDINKCENRNTEVQIRTLISSNSNINKCENELIIKKITTINNKNIIEKEINKEKEEKSELDNVCLSIFDHWNNANILRCLDLTPRLKGIIRYALKFFTENEIKTCIDRYDTVLHDKSYFYTYTCSLKSFLTKSNAMKDFTDTGDKWRAYNKWEQGNTAPDEFIHNNYTKEQIASLLTDLDNVDV